MELRIENLTKVYPNGVRALDGVSLTIPRGLYGLLGPNGAGKSTLMRILATLQEADSGTVTLDGIDVLRQKEEVRKMLGYLPQDFGVYPKISALDMMDHLALLKGFVNGRERRELVDALLHRVNLWGVRKKALSGYSGGMRQRFGIGQALIGDPTLLIVDEPTAGLDPSERNRFYNLLSEVGENVVVILSTHIVQDVMELCTNTAIIDKGRVMFAGAPDVAIRELAGRIWRRTIAKAELPDYERRFRVISNKLVAGRPQIHIYSDAAPGDGFETATPDLEDVFFSKISPASAAQEQA
ncbi:MAG TPA: ABC transporter ATP-binding protein [Bryobacteraceae bacterium]|nr:ABC transporter ATP-binding protein [Bryobacteraceae bacterium]